MRCYTHDEFRGIELKTNVKVSPAGVGVWHEQRMYSSVESRFSSRNAKQIDYMQS